MTMEPPTYAEAMYDEYGSDAIDDCARVWLKHDEEETPTVEGGMVLLDKLNAVFQSYDIAEADRTEFALTGLYRFTMYRFQQQEHQLRPHFDDIL